MARHALYLIRELEHDPEFEQLMSRPTGSIQIGSTDLKKGFHLTEQIPDSKIDLAEIHRSIEESEIDFLHAVEDTMTKDQKKT